MIPRRWLGRALPATLVLLALALPLEGAPRQLSLLVVTPEAGDPRVELVAAAVASWNRAFEELHLAPALEAPSVLVQAAESRALETYAHQIATQAGRMNAGVNGPPAPGELLNLDHDLVVLLSTQPLMPFAVPFEHPADSRSRFFVAIPDRHPKAPPLDQVIAHEIGHALGLEHGDDATALMCEPCARMRGSRGRPSGALPRPLTEADRARLLELYPRAP